MAKKGLFISCTKDSMNWMMFEAVCVTKILKNGLGILPVTVFTDILLLPYMEEER